MYFVTVIQKTANGDYANNIFRYETLDEAKAKAYTELAYGFASELELCAVSVSNDLLNILLKDVYKKTRTEPNPVEMPEA